MADSSAPSVTAPATIAVAVTGSAPSPPFDTVVPPAPATLVAPGSPSSESAFSVVEDATDIDDSLLEDEARDSDASTEAEDNVQAPKKPLSLAEAFQMLSIAAEAVSHAAAAAAVVAAAPPPVDAPVSIAGSAVQSTGPWIAGSLYNVVPAGPLTAVPDNGERWYSITKGRALSSNAVLGVSGAVHNVYTRQADALAAFNMALGIHLSLLSRFLPRWAWFPYRWVCVVSSMELEDLFDSLSLEGTDTESSLSSSNEEYYSAEEHTTPPILRTPPRRAQAAHATIGVPDSATRRLTPRTRKTGGSAGYALFFGKVPGWYKTWEEVQPLIKDARGALYQGYPTLQAARAAYEYATSKMWTGVCSGTSAAPCTRILPSQLPTPLTVAGSTNPLHCGKWYIVYKGIKPGVYQSMVECGLHTSGIKGSTYDSDADCLQALARYLHAEEHGHTYAYPYPDHL
ncbi:hypothetical protein C8F04DRAFT_1181507 [Mycena alexandri]|uniref:Ribonuclease H1 N-terminal domain-containing protein n=1 Tax=Mycena alexandri TaxID=1745969 RepID=A0AAD6SZA3_9AGAR|nr:hypothetical protein C8F04DRAFT_1181507 [Mycena alexandri]